jgi:hypothetical protein
VIDDKLYVLKLNSTVLECLSSVLKESKLTGEMLLDISRENGLYATTEKAIRKAFNKSKTSSSSNDPLLQSNASFFTAKLSDVEELVRFWHINLGHASKRNMITIVENKLIDGLGDEITAAQIAKHFPECADCVHGNMAQKRHPKSADRVYKIGETLAIDVLEAGSEFKGTEATSSPIGGKLKVKKSPN